MIRSQTNQEGSPLNFKKNHSNRKTFKAFTLVELIIVIAIIGILAAMTSLFMPGFIRDANLETYNKTAQMAYTGMQNCIVNWELTQDDSCLDTNALSATPVASYKEITYSTIKFTVGAGNTVGEKISVSTIYDNVPAQTVSLDLEHDSLDNANKKVFEKLSKMIKDNFGSMIEGTFVICIDYEEFTVDSVVYMPPSEGASNIYAQTMNWTVDDASIAPAKVFSGCADLDTQIAFYKAGKQNCGGYYPMAASVSGPSGYKIVDKDAKLPIDEEDPPETPETL